ncbi:MAG: deaminase [Candidatus Caldatribacteriota bacterium]|jgi:deoxycytidylate deaminase|nr:deaminase [Patescibacteria group bacterium]
MQLNRFIKLAVEEAKKSDHKQRIGAIIFDKSKIISKGFNSSQKSVKHLKKKFQRWPGTVHAEVDAIIKARTDVKGLSMIVIRINNFNQLKLAKPCKWCQMYIKYVGIKKVIYSLNEFPYLEEMRL